MPKLLIVESPTKIKVLHRILKEAGDNFYLLPTFGHLKDLPRNSLGIDLNSLKPKFVYLKGKSKVLKALNALAIQVKEVYLATDPDREGEAISYHVQEYLGKLNQALSFYRLDLWEITPLGVKEAFSNLRRVDENLYQSYLARRVLDRLIGYKVSPFLFRNFKQPLSAGRVQSPALRLIVDRERERENFQREISYGLKIIFQKGNQTFEAELYHKNLPHRWKTKKEVEEFLERFLQGKIFRVSSLTFTEIKEAPPAPFKTSTLIEEAGKVFGFSAKETMQIAQRLYELGYITYHRTDSTRVSPLAKDRAHHYIAKKFGETYCGKRTKRAKAKFAQEAHEAVRPTQLEKITSGLSPKESKLYHLIWLRFLASEMVPATYLEKKVEVNTPELPPDYTLRYQARKLTFPGFRILYKEKEEEPTVELLEGQEVKLIKHKLERHQTKPPPRYTEESLIKKMESIGIGRPSTYATMLDILYQRGYVKKIKRELVPTDLGQRICDFLLKRTPFFMDYQYTASVESELDEIARGTKDYSDPVKKVLQNLEACLKP